MVAGAAAAAHGPAVARNLTRYHWEDWRFFRHARTQLASVGDCFTRPSAWPGLYRPLSTNCYYFVGRRLFGNRVAPYHVVNAAVYLVNGVLLFIVARRLLPLPLALLAPALWVSRVAHRQVLLYTSEFQALGSTFFSLLALALALSTRAAPPESRPRGWREPAALAAFAAALLSKESAVALPAIVTAAAWLFGAARWRRELAWWGLVAAWGVLFVLVFRGVSGYAPTGFTYDLSPRMATRLAAYALMASNAIVLPVDDWTVPPRVPMLAAQPAVALSLAAGAAGVVALLACARRARARGRPQAARVMALGLAWFVAASAPFAIFEDRLFLRYAYFGSAGLALLLAALPEALAEWWRLRGRAGAAPPAATGPTSAPAPP